VEYSVRFKSSAMIKSLTTMVESKRLSVQLRPPHFKQEARRTEKIMRLPIKLIEKLNNLTNCEMNMYLWLCENQNDNGAVSGIRPSDFLDIMSKQSFYNALNGLNDKGLIRLGLRKKRHEYKISLNEVTIVGDEWKEGYINLNKKLFQCEDFKKLKSREKYLMLLFYVKTSVAVTPSGTKAVHSIEKDTFYEKYSKLLNRSKRRIMEYMHSLKKFFNINIKLRKRTGKHQEETVKEYKIGRNRNTYSLDVKEDKNGRVKHRRQHVMAMVRKYNLKGVTEEFINDVIGLYKNHIKNYTEARIDRAMEWAIRTHSKENNITASAARINQLLKQRIEMYGIA
jgi:hypothetical protein